MDDSEKAKRREAYMQKRLEKKNNGAETGNKVNLADRIPPGQHYSERQVHFLAEITNLHTIQMAGVGSWKQTRNAHRGRLDSDREM